MFSVILNRRAAKFLDTLDIKLRTKLIDAIEDLAEYPFSLKRHGVKKIQGRDRTFRMRMGSVRMIFYVDKKSERIIILKIDYREAVYAAS